MHYHMHRLASHPVSVSSITYAHRHVTRPRCHPPPKALTIDSVLSAARAVYRDDDRHIRGSAHGDGTALGMPMQWRLDWEADGLGFTETVSLSPSISSTSSGGGGHAGGHQQPVALSSAFSHREGRGGLLSQTDLSGG